MSSMSKNRWQKERLGLRLRLQTKKEIRFLLGLSVARAFVRYQGCELVLESLELVSLVLVSLVLVSLGCLGFLDRYCLVIGFCRDVDRPYQSDDRLV